MKYYVYCEKALFNQEEIFSHIKKILTDLAYRDELYVQYQILKEEDKCIALIKYKGSTTKSYQFKAIINI